MSKRHIFCLFCPLLFALALMLFLPARAQARPLLTQLGGQSISVPAGRSVESILAVGSDAHIAGRVTDVVLVINGNTYLEKSARVDLVIDLGGHVINLLPPGNNTDIFQVEFTQKFINQMFIAGSVLVSFWFLRILTSIFSIVLLTGLGYTLRQHLEKTEHLLSLARPRLFGIGTAALLAVLAVVILLILSVLGIPIALILLLLGFIAAFIGTLAIIDYAAKKTLSARILEYPDITRWLIGSSLFVALINLPLIGLIILFGFTVTGLGLVLTSLWLHFKHKRDLRTQS